MPAKSVFTPHFVRALRGEADHNKDGYVTGTELGAYLHEVVLSYHQGQEPQYGKILDTDLNEGDFVFRLPRRTPPPPTALASSSLALSTALALFGRASKDSARVSCF